MEKAAYFGWLPLKQEYSRNRSYESDKIFSNDQFGVMKLTSTNSRIKSALVHGCTKVFYSFSMRISEGLFYNIPTFVDV